MAKVWENINGRCYCYGHLAPDRGCDGANCRDCCYNLGKSGTTTGELTLAQYIEANGPSILGAEKPLPDGAKKIKDIAIEKNGVYLDPNGEDRVITIIGDTGATFSLTIKDSSGCNILKEKLENVKISNNKFSFTQKFPAIKNGVTSETYSFDITGAAETVIPDVFRENEGNYFVQLYQYPNPTITVTKATTQTFDSGKTISISGSNITKTEKAGSRPVNMPGYTSTEMRLICTESSSASGYFYVNNSRFEDNVTSDLLIKKVLKRDDITDRSAITVDDKNLLAAPPTSDGTSIETQATLNATRDLQSYAWWGEVSYTKTVHSSLEATDGTKINDCNDATDRFKLENANDLFEDMTVTCISDGKYIKDKIVKVWDNVLTLSSKHVIRKNTILTFKYREDGVIGETTTLPHNTAIEISSDDAKINGHITKVSGSGTNTVTITTKVDFIKTGKKDITFTLDVDGIIAREPNAYDQEVKIKKDTATRINMILKDQDSNAISKTATVTSGPHNGSVSAFDGEKNSITYTPHTGFIGEDHFNFTMSDGTNSSDEKTIFITVN
jgi:hypothetical protein